MKKKRPRAEARLRQRALGKLVRDKQRLAALEAGGAPDRPIEVPSSSVIPVRARSTVSKIGSPSRVLRPRRPVTAPRTHLAYRVCETLAATFSPPWSAT